MHKELAASNGAAAAAVPGVNPADPAMLDRPATMGDLATLVGEIRELAAAILARPPEAPAEKRVNLRELDFWTYGQAAEASGAAESAVRRLVKEGKLKAARIGKYGAWVVRRADVEALEL